VDVLVCNAGSSSLKLRLLDAGDELVWQRDLEADHGDVDTGELRDALAEAGHVDATGHRVVHGGPSHTAAERVDAALLRDLQDLTALAPLHQPPALHALAAVQEALPGVPAVACFDTSFHATLPAAARTYALPAAWRERHGLRRYGFHGLSHAYASRRAAALAPGARRIVTCHLGAGASLAAVLDGRSVDTTMGFTPLAGLVMATRAGDVDPGLLTWLLERGELTAAELGDGLTRASGLRGLAGTGDMREVLERRAAGDEQAALAFDVYVHRLRAAIAAMTASLGGLDALVFTGGVGERSALVRQAAVEELAFLGVAIDAAANAAAEGDADVSDAAAEARTLVVAAREDLEIADGVRAALHGCRHG
jgi:acetate kinase